MRAQTEVKKRHFAIFFGTAITAIAAFAFGPLVSVALAQTDALTVTGAPAPSTETVAGNDSGTIPNSSYSGTGPAPAAAIPDHPAVDTPTPTPSPAVQQ